MSQNFFEQELRKGLRSEIESGRLREVGDSMPFFEQLARSYPALGSKIDWTRVPGSIVRVEEDQALHVAAFTRFFEEMAPELSGDVVYVGDSATDAALAGSLGAMRRALGELLTVPQHHYFLGEDCSWCICFSMEGDMGFGFRPGRPRGR